MHALKSEQSIPWRDDTRAIAHTAIHALQRDCGRWATATLPDVEVIDYSGMGGGKTYKIANRADPSAQPVAMHILHEAYCPDPGDTVFFDRKRAAQALLAEAGLTLPRICEDPQKTWFIDQWRGEPVSVQDISVVLVEAVARLIARVHALDTGWIKEIRARQRKRYPALAHTPEANHIWPFVSQAHHFIDAMSESFQLGFIDAGPTPISAAGSRLVTIHGDVHPGNLLRTDDDLLLIDMDFACVGFAVQDISYTLATLCATEDLKDAFLHAYLVACALPASPADVFALRLDAERCKMAANWLDSNAAIQAVLAGKAPAGIGKEYADLVRVADAALIDQDLAEEIVAHGFENCKPTRQIIAVAGTPRVGVPVCAHSPPPDQAERSHLVINWDGTIQSAAERHRGLVLGIDANGEIILTNYTDIDRRLLLDPAAARTAVTGLAPPSGDPVPLALAGNHQNQALVLADHTHNHQGNTVEYVVLGPAENAMSVHLEPNGMIRLADRPDQTFDCSAGMTEPGIPVIIYHAHGEDGQRFLLNEDGSISPVGNRGVVWGWNGVALRLVRREDPRAERLTFDSHVVRAARINRTVAALKNAAVGAEQATESGGCLLALASHAGLAISAEAPGQHSGFARLILEPLDQAQRFFVTSDHLCLAGGGVVALGKPGDD